MRVTVAKRGCVTLQLIAVEQNLGVVRERLDATGFDFPKKPGAAHAQSVSGSSSVKKDVHCQPASVH